MTIQVGCTSSIQTNWSCKRATSTRWHSSQSQVWAETAGTTCYNVVLYILYIYIYMYMVEECWREGLRRASGCFGDQCRFSTVHIFCQQRKVKTCIYWHIYCKTQRSRFVIHPKVWTAAAMFMLGDVTWHWAGAKDPCFQGVLLTTSEPGAGPSVWYPHWRSSSHQT